MGDKAEAELMKGIEEVDEDYYGEVGEALLRRYGIRQGRGLRKGYKIDDPTEDSTVLKRRQREAAEILGLSPRTFERNYLPEYIEALAKKLHDMVA